MRGNGSPRFVRPFWVNVESSARKTPIGTGPDTLDGSLDLDLKVRENGTVMNALRVACRVVNGKQTIRVTDGDGREVFYREWEG